MEQPTLRPEHSSNVQSLAIVGNSIAAAGIAPAVAVAAYDQPANALFLERPNVHGVRFDIAESAASDGLLRISTINGPSSAPAAASENALDARFA